MSLPVSGIGGAAATTATSTGTAVAKKDDKQAECFELLMLGQLTRTLIDSALPSGDETSAATNTYKDLLPDALTEALMSGGGIGLATTLKGLEK
jgi:Rod binding domain-containing protein